MARSYKLKAVTEYSSTKTWKQLSPNGKFEFPASARFRTGKAIVPATMMKR